MRKTINIPKDRRPVAQRQRVFARVTGSTFDVRTAAGATEIALYDQIGPGGITASAFRDRLKAISGKILLKINSPGGDVFDGIAIHNDLIAHPGDVRVEVTGVAASAASIVAMAGTEIAIASNAFLMIHRAWSLTIGNTEHHAEVARILAQIDGSLAGTYAARTGQDLKAIEQWMSDETWFGADAAIDSGFADERIGDQSETAKAAFDLSVYARVPDALKQPGRSGLEIRSPNDLDQALRAGGLSRSQAKAVVHGGYAALTSAQDDDTPASAISSLAERVAAATAELKRTV